MNKEMLKTNNNKSETIIKKENLPRALFQEKTNSEKPQESIKFSNEENQVEIFIENYLRQNYLRINTKSKQDKGILYETTVVVNKIKVNIDCFYFYKKIKESELIKFYTSSIKPKIVFIEKCPKKLFTLAEELDNLTIVNI